ncbi:hypothetical protein [Delftia acidovorans]
MELNQWFEESIKAINALAPEKEHFLFWYGTQSELAAWTQAWFSAVGIAFSGIISWITISGERRRVDRARQEEKRKAELEKKEMHSRADSFIRGACAAINAISAASVGQFSKTDVLLKNAVLKEELATSRLIDLAKLDRVNAGVVIAAQSLCEHLDILMAEERNSLSQPPLQVLKKYLPELNARAKAISEAWQYGKSLGASKTISNY